ncbi:MAG: Arm DNA-binding domain-containing protein, partial [Lutibacter sp.]|nr:Arm DNA-binding domain-containing protein [Lutibacter sp.]
MENSFNLLFYIKKTKADPNGKTMIYMRITVNGRRSELSIQRKIDVLKWNTQAGRAKGYSEEVQKINTYIDIIQNKIYKIHQKFIENNIPYSAEKIRDHYLGIDEAQKMLLEIFEEHNKQVEKLIGKDFAPGTAERYNTAKMHVEDYIKKDYKLNDIPIKNVDHKFITG